jgi:hypothetical protein
MQTPQIVMNNNGSKEFALRFRVITDLGEIYTNGVSGTRIVFLQTTTFVMYANCISIRLMYEWYYSSGAGIVNDPKFVIW